jgi:MoaA/NifB/PqqE/SkfB family radical SAM enzyme
MRSYASLIVRLPLYNSFRKLGGPKLLPINYVFSITNNCNSKCKTCSIWKLYQERPELRSEELTTQEWFRVFESLNNSPFWVTISGGEPYIRNDLVEICKAICETNRPKILNIPTNGLLYERIKNWTPKIAEACAENDVSLVINLSLDGISELHDETRGIKGNWELTMKTLLALKELKSKNQSLTVGIHTVISKYNLHKLPEIAAYAVDRLNPDHYIMEVAEERSELFNVNSGITPQPEELKCILTEVTSHLRNSSRHLKGPSKISLAFRLRYYELIPKILENKKQIVPCMASFASCHINPYGDVWPCCILGYNMNIGNLRTYDFNFKRLWKSKRANEVRKIIKEEGCACPLANAYYTNLLLNFKEIFRLATKAAK